MYRIERNRRSWRSDPFQPLKNGNNLTQILLKHGRHFDYWCQPLNMRMRVCYLDCHDAGLCCYLVIQIETFTSITAVLLPFVTYLLTLPRTKLQIRTSWGNSRSWISVIECELNYNNAVLLIGSWTPLKYGIMYIYFSLMLKRDRMFDTEHQKVLLVSSKVTAVGSVSLYKVTAS
jgi:hypothetical protein